MIKNVDFCTKAGFYTEFFLVLNFFLISFIRGLKYSISLQIFCKLKPLRVILRP